MKIEKASVPEEEWKDWKWQQRNAIREPEELKGYFTRINPAFFERIFAPSRDRLKFQITPYMLAQIPHDISEEELARNPWFLQFFPQGDVYIEGPDAYNGRENWDMQEEFPTTDLPKVAKIKNSELILP